MLVFVLIDSQSLFAGITKGWLKQRGNEEVKHNVNTCRVQWIYLLIEC
jgi:hypothetical protein